MDIPIKRGKVVRIEYDDTTTSIIVSDLNTTTNMSATSHPVQRSVLRILGLIQVVIFMYIIVCKKNLAVYNAF